MVDFYVSGISHTDRNALIDAVEDAVLNCRSASENGVGNGANFNVLYILDNIISNQEYDNDVEMLVYNILHNAYLDLFLKIYENYINNDQMEEEKIIVGSMMAKKPFNLRTGKYDGKVLTSIRADEVILDAVAKIVGLIFKTNQAIVASPAQNTYEY
ncbi:MAG: hypothetical protein IJ880_10945 [Bacilli bacterium]|nr:hypothetical protein [Bacilli bacterium]